MVNKRWRVMLPSTLYCRERVVCCSWRKQQLRTQVRLSNNCFLYQHPKWSFSSSWKKFIVSMFQIPRHADRYKFKKVVWFHICNTSLKKFDFICNASNFSSLQAVTHGSPPHYTVDHVLYHIILINLWLSIMKQNYSLQATTHANLLAGTRLQLLFTSLTVSNDIWKSLLLHHFEQKRTRTFNRKTEDVAHTQCVIIPNVNLKRQLDKRQIWHFLTTEMTLEIAIRTYSDGDGWNICRWQEIVDGAGWRRSRSSSR